MFEKSRTDEMRRLRSVGFSLAHADRLARSKRGPGLMVFGCSAAGVLLLGGIVALGFDMTRTAQEQTQTQAAVLEARQADALAASTLLALQQNRISQSLALQERAEPAVADQTARAAGSLAATLEPEPKAVVAETVSPETVAAETIVAANCVSDLSRLAQGINLSFDPASALLSDAASPTLGTLTTALAGCDDARLMVGGHSDSTGPEIANIQISWQRADAAMSQLVALGARPDQIEVIGFGARVPYAPDAPGTEPKNRRVVFRVIRREEVQG